MLKVYMYITHLRAGDFPISQGGIGEFSGGMYVFKYIQNM